MLFKAWAKYQQLVARRPLLTQAVTLSVLYSIGDICAQGIEKNFLKKETNEESKDQVEKDNIATTSTENNNFNVNRVLRFGSFGLLIDAPILFWWYRLLDTKIPSTTSSAVIKKLALDQMLCAPFVYFLFFPFLGILKQHSYEQISEKIRKDFLKTYLFDCALWIPANLINFRYISPQYRVAYTGVITFFWTVYLAFIGEA